MDLWQHIIRPGDVWGRFTLYLKQNGQAAVQREVVRSLRLRVRDVVLDLGGGGRALAQLALYSVNLRILGNKANQVISARNYDLVVSLGEIPKSILVSSIITVLIIAITAAIITCIFVPIDKEYISYVILTGGSSKIPYIQEHLKTFFSVGNHFKVQVS